MDRKNRRSALRQGWDATMDYLLGFLRWIARGDFPLDTRRIVSDALAGHFPECPFPA